MNKEDPAGGRRKMKGHGEKIKGCTTLNKTRPSPIIKTNSSVIIQKRRLSFNEENQAMNCMYA